MDDNKRPYTRIFGISVAFALFTAWLFSGATAGLIGFSVCFLAIEVTHHLRTQRRNRRQSTVPDGGVSPQTASRDEIIHRSLDSIRPGDRVENVARACLREIAICEGWLNDAPKEWEYLWQWEKRSTSEDQKTLARTLRNQLSRRQSEITENQIKQGTERLWQVHQPIVTKFLEIAERKVSILDEYGDERWDFLPKEIETCLDKILKAELTRDGSEHRFSFNNSGWFSVRQRLSERLREAFVSHHAQMQSRPADGNRDELSGSEFEILVSRILKTQGYEVSGTPATGDQGADLIASKDGKKIAVQAKRYKGSVGNKAVQEVTAAINFYGATEGWVVTNATFTPAAKALAQKNNVRLIDGDELSRMSRGMDQSAGS